METNQVQNICTYLKVNNLINPINLTYYRMTTNLTYLYTKQLQRILHNCPSWINMLLAIAVISFTIFISSLLTGCKEEITSPPEIFIPPIDIDTTLTNELKGKVILENQTEHSNTLVYLDSLNRGASTDSSGFFFLQFSENDTIYNGVFMVYYFVNEFEMDSAMYVLVNGKVKLDSLDVDSEGNLPTKDLKQLLLIEGWTDKTEYRIGDTIEFTANFTNVTNRAVHINIATYFNQLGYVFLYNENHSAPFVLSPCDPIGLDFNTNLIPGQFYQGRVFYLIPDGYYCGDFVPLIPDEFIVVADLFIEGRLLNFWTNKLDNFIVLEWEKLHRGKAPSIDWFPNKYNYPIINIIE